ncbi:HD-GYP domain-containing protein [Alicyclobacillus dauci]|uniref:HD-GYP domain-containing protein n=1 Tax=Alicyclobacillus dauci TaxID=1475485 RepID=A0ABY6YZU3_9BACL|nr:HD-GYP domain-containing protein [Alicyclobacillus dauci]WAH36107.1 HD-GYP domain-containing protein [Alicyclobacillus dauci]
MNELRIIGSKVETSVQEASFQFANVEASLMTRTPYYEMIRHHLKKGAYWSLVPSSKQGMAESCTVETGEVEVHVQGDTYRLYETDVLSLIDLAEFVVFHAVRDTTLIYLSSQPVYDPYFELVGKIQKLAVEIELKDGYTSRHCSRIMEWSLAVGRELGLSPERLYHLQHGAFFHDVGKVAIPNEILGKPGRLTAEEWEIMKTHPLRGSELLREIYSDQLSEPSVIVEQHHERYDGSGYPFGLRGDEIHIGAAIVAVVDSYDAMTTNRIYQRAKPPQQALQEIKQLSGQLYDPRVVDAFCKVIERDAEIVRLAADR